MFLKDALGNIENEFEIMDEKSIKANIKVEKIRGEG